MSNYTIRTILPTDNSSLATIIRNTLTEFNANHPGTVFTDPTTDKLFELFQTPHSAYFVAEVENRIVGGGGIFPSKGLPARTCELVKMYLLPEARGLRLGKAIIDKAIEFARAEGFDQIYIETMPELEKAVSVYEKYGFERLSGPLGDTGHFGCSIWMLKGIVEREA